VLSVCLGIPLWLTIVILGVVTVIYDTIGGITAVVYSDVIQMVILVGGIIICIIYAGEMIGSLANVWAAFPEMRRIAIESERKRGLDLYLAVIQSAISRFRPILMTTITTILGVMPLILWRNPLFYTLSINIAIGLAFGTVLTLGVAPCLYSIFFRVKVKI
jgi:Na+/proline symporter